MTTKILRKIREKPIKKPKTKLVYFEFEDDITDDELREYAKAKELDDYAFSRITGADLSDADDLFRVSRDGVELAPIDEHALRLVDESDRMHIREAARHRLQFPCTPAELVTFVGKVDWYFDVPEDFLKMVTEATVAPIAEAAAAKSEAKGCGGEPAKRTRSDPMSAEIEAAINELSGGTAPAMVMWKLKTFANKDGSCITKAGCDGESFVEWKSTDGTNQVMDIGALKGRLARRNKKR